MEQQLLPTFEPSEDDMVQMALNQPLEDKISRSIGLLKLWEYKANKLDKRGFRICFSGGKDSEVIKQLAKESGVNCWFSYNETTIDPPELIYHIRKYHKDVVWNKAKKPMLSLMFETGKTPPTFRGRWCCDEYKHRFGNEEACVVGVRVSESKKRMARWREFNPSKSGAFELAPIVYWTDKDVWDFIKDRGLKYCELYDQGFDRLGCVGCPLNPDSRLIEFKRWPKYEKMWKRAIEKAWLKWKDIPNKYDEPRWWSKFNNVNEIWDWWMQQESEEGCTFENFMSNV